MTKTTYQKLRGLVDGLATNVRRLERAEAKGKLARKNARSAVLKTLRQVREELDVVTGVTKVRIYRRATLLKGYDYILRTGKMFSACKKANVPICEMSRTNNYMRAIPGWASVIGPSVEDLKRTVKDPKLRAARQAEWALQRRPDIRGQS